MSDHNDGPAARSVPDLHHIPPSTLDLLGELRAAAERASGQADVCALCCAFLEFFPLPAWMKVPVADGEFRMLRVNRVFEQTVGISQIDYAGKSTHELLGETIAYAEESLEADRFCATTGQNWTGIVTAPNFKNARLQGETQRTWEVHKFPLFNSAGHLIGVAGFTREIVKGT